jgi:OmpA-OmpF porin, OOP family
MNTKALLTLLALLGWILFCNWWWCSNKENCDCDKLATDTAAATTTTGDGNASITFNAGSAGAITGANWTSMRDSLLNLVRAGKRLNIVGYYGSKEQNTTKFQNLGIARADSIKQLFLAADASLNKSRFTTIGESRDNLDNATAPFDASSIAALDTVATPKAEGGVVATDSNDILIYFPTGSANKTLSKEVDDYLIKLGARLKASGEKAAIIGHTDNKGKYESNLKLSQDRAAQIKGLLVKDGAVEANLSTEGKADKEPIGDNTTDAGRAQNRRVEIKISK